ncbi:hypothetical protein PUNSTDRAFT_131505 [Punctularia strigosozonata HHB-11173 SS5]|uniref:uncharacterized protein n=1 Tax=Punctularia strigosozonata (strain HHB-11173) TaxID=741275 RepID=UPI00044164C8|nr:uncharacterized protein PUNSTDRAFT_131505 [Punctularia strigosozonata HHB-11173 SS5]EIN11341.1 hypothetical protein PUNSTDRAFT_131505 [Punctularia strigosozonata HHB-11173 SS5]
MRSHSGLPPALGVTSRTRAPPRPPLTNPEPKLPTWSASRLPLAHLLTRLPTSRRLLASLSLHLARLSASPPLAAFLPVSQPLSGLHSTLCSHLPASPPPLSQPQARAANAVALGVASLLYATSAQHEPVTQSCPSRYLPVAYHPSLSASTLPTPPMATGGISMLLM